MEGIFKKWQFWISFVLLLTVAVPKTRGYLFSLGDIAYASELKDEKEYRNTIAALQFEILKTQNLILSILADSTEMDSTFRAFLMDSLKENLDILKHQVWLADSTHTVVSP